MSDSQECRFGELFQLQLIYLLITDESFFLKCKELLKSSFFTVVYLDFFYQRTIFHYNKYNQLPGELVFLNEIDMFAEGEKKDALSALYKKIIDNKPKDVDYIKQTLIDFIKEKQFILFYNSIHSNFGKDPNQTYEICLKEIEQIVNLKFDNDEIVFLSDAEVLCKEDRESNIIVPTGVDTFDHALNGGIRQEELCVFLGDSGVGKSIILINIGAQALIKGLKVLHINLEGRKNIPIIRYLSCLSGAPYNEIRTQVFKEEKDKIAYGVAKEKYKDNLYVLHMANFEITVEDVYAKCKEIRKKFPFDVLIVDYGDLLKTKDKMELRHQQTFVFRSLARMGTVFNVPVVTASQATRPEKDYSGGNVLKWLNLRDMSESYEKVRVSSIIISINRNEREEAENKLRLMLCKNRDGEKSIKRGCYSKYSIMRPYGFGQGFYDPYSEVVDEVTMQNH